MPGRALLAAGGRMTGFVMLAGLGMAILAGVVLLPAWARLAWTEYERDCLAATVKDEQAARRTLDRMIGTIDTDPILNKRLAMAQLGYRPVGQVVIRDDTLPPVPPPGAVIPAEHPRPEPPSPALTRAAQRVGNPPTRRGLYLMSAAALLGAVMLFGPPPKRAEA